MSHLCLLSILNKLEDLHAWQKCRELINHVCELTSEGEFSRDFGLRDQLRDAAVSALTNIVEGYARTTPKEFAYFHGDVRACAYETFSLPVVAKDAGHISAAEYSQLSEPAEHSAALEGAFRSKVLAKATSSAAQT